MNRAVFLDRDGVINRAVVRDGHPHAPASMEEIEFLPGVGSAIERLQQAGFRVIVVTNQPDVGKGRVARETVEAMHAVVARAFAVDAVKVCYHTDQDACHCRKPKPGLLLEAAQEWHVDLKASILVGDRWRDIEAGKAAGCKTVWIRSAYDERAVQEPDAIVDSLEEASRVIIVRWASRGGVQRGVLA